MMALWRGGGRVVMYARKLAVRARIVSMETVRSYILLANYANIWGDMEPDSTYEYEFPWHGH